MVKKHLLAWILIVGGLIGILFSGLITYEKMALLANPDHIPPCSINPILSCGSVMQTWQASLFGFPNSFLGLVGFGVITAIGASMLAGAVYRRWFLLSAQAGLSAALAFVLWLFFQSLYRIGALCPYCLVIWAVTILQFWYLLAEVLPEKVKPSFQAAVDTLKKWPFLFALVTYLVIVLAILQRFWPYWKSLLT